MPIDFALDPRPKLRLFFRQVGDTTLPSPLHLLVYTRELLEYLGDTAFPFARLYGNWAVHTRISGSAAGYEMLGRINGHLATVGAGAEGFDPRGSLAPFAEAIAGELSTGKLLLELRRLFERENIPAPCLYRADWWPHLRAGLLGELRAKPIQFPDGDPSAWKPPVRAIYDEAREKVQRAHGHTRGFVRHFMIDILHVPGKHATVDKGSLHWMCITENKFRIQGEIKGAMLDDGAKLFE